MSEVIPFSFIIYSFQSTASPFFAGYLFIQFSSPGNLVTVSLRLMFDRFSFSLFFTLSACQVGLNNLEFLCTLI